jgi:hypothetical protein
MAVMTDAVHEPLPAHELLPAHEVIPLQRVRRSGPAAAPLQIVRISSDAPLAAQLLLPAGPAGPADVARIAPLLPIQRDRRSRRAAPVRGITGLAVAMGTSVLVWLAIVGAVVALGHTL